MKNQLYLLSRRASKLFSTVSPFARSLITASALHSETPARMLGSIDCAANHVPLSPITFLERAAIAYSNNTSIVYGSISHTWSQTYHRCRKLASALITKGISRGDVVATLCPNVPAMYELHFSVPMAGAVLCTLNSRHDSKMISTMLNHSESKILFVDYELEEIARGAIELLEIQGEAFPEMIVISDEYEMFLQSGESGKPIRNPLTETDPISINYTSGTTSSPKGVVYSHRGAYINSLASLMMHGIGQTGVYLWTVPMFHCNGWCLVWGMAAAGGRNMVTHMGGAPTVLRMIAKENRPIPHKVEIMTGGAAPNPQLMYEIENLGFAVSHLYGLTESYGPATSCVWKSEWESLRSEERAEKKGTQGVRNVGLEEVDVRDPITMESVPCDGRTIGEIMMRGNTVMRGYLKDEEATREAMQGGWLRTGDLGVKHGDGYLEVRDRAKDVIVTGGENVNSIEVERVLCGHPGVEDAAVVGRPDQYWGETPCAFVEVKEGFRLTEGDLIRFCRSRLPPYMAPRSVVFQKIPRTCTGKLQKLVLRETAKALGTLYV